MTTKVLTCPNCGASINYAVDSEIFKVTIGKPLMMSVDLGGGETVTFGFILEGFSIDASIGSIPQFKADMRREVAENATEPIL